MLTAPGYSLTTRSTVSAGTSSAAWNVTSQPLSGTVSGLAGTGLVLQVNGADNITVASGSTSFRFSNNIGEWSKLQRYRTDRARRTAA